MNSRIHKSKTVIQSSTGNRGGVWRVLMRRLEGKRLLGRPGVEGKLVLKYISLVALWIGTRRGLL
jgi:hypothetical protein